MNFNGSFYLRYWFISVGIKQNKQESILKSISVKKLRLGTNVLLLSGCESVVWGELFSETGVQLTVRD